MRNELIHNYDIIVNQKKSKAKKKIIENLIVENKIGSKKGKEKKKFN